MSTILCLTWTVTMCSTVLEQKQRCNCLPEKCADNWCDKLAYTYIHSYNVCSQKKCDPSELLRRSVPSEMSAPCAVLWWPHNQTLSTSTRLLMRSIETVPLISSIRRFVIPSTLSETLVLGLSPCSQQLRILDGSESISNISVNLTCRSTAM